MKKKPILLSGLVLLIAFLIIIVVAGTYTAFRLLGDSQPQAAALGSGGRVIESVMVSNNGAPVAVRTTILPAPELPQTDSTASGILLSRNDNALIVGTGAIELQVDIEVNGESGQEQVNMVPSTNGPELEVVVTNETQIFEDATDFNGEDESQNAERTVQQTVRRIDSLEEIAVHDEIQVWGERTGTRVIAKALVYGPLGGGTFE